jgi:hypothetical protein
MRKLVGLRWWNEFDEEGTEKLFFESSDAVTNDEDTKVFW